MDLKIEFKMNFIFKLMINILIKLIVLMKIQNLQLYQNINKMQKFLHNNLNKL